MENTPQLFDARNEIVRAEIDMQISTAKAYPRDVAACKQELIDLVTMDVDTAEACWYSLPRDGKEIEGPSVRLAEMAVSCWGNVRAGWRVVSIAERFVECEGICHDLQKNVVCVATAKRSIWGQYGRYKENMIQTTTMAAGAIAYRNAVYKAIPAVLTKTALQAAQQTVIKAVGDYKERLAGLEKAFAEMDVDRARLMKYFRLEKLTDISAAQFLAAQGIYNAIRGGEAEPADYFGGRRRSQAGSQTMSVDAGGDGSQVEDEA